MREQKGVALVVYKTPNRKPRYLVMKRKLNWEGWELPKGHLENGDYEETVRIELREEAGIEEVEEIQETGETLEWEFEDDGENVKSVYKVFIVRVGDDQYADVSENPDDEHESGHFFSFEDATSLLTYEEHVEALEDARETIEG